MTYQRALIQAHVAVFFMGISAILATLAGFAAWRTTSYRVAFGGAVLLMIGLARKRDKLPSLGKALLFLGLGVVLSVHWFAFFRSIELLGVTFGSAMIGVEPIFIAVAALIFLKEHLNRRAKIALVISLLGFVVLGFGQGYDQPGLLAGIAWSLFGFSLFAVLVLANRVWVRGESAIWLSCLEMIGAIPLSVWMTDGDWLPADPVSWSYALALGLFCTGLAYGFYNSSMKVLTAPTAGLLLSLEVVYGFTGGWLIGDDLDMRQCIAVVLIANILLSDVWVYWRSRKKGRAVNKADS